MSDNLSLKELMELAKMKESRPREYKKTMDDIKAVSTDIMKIGMEVLEEMKDE